MDNQMLGCRVIRGPDWEWGDQDGGQGSVGTVIRTKGSLVVVQWDAAVKKNNYRAGHDGKCDVLIYDNGPTGVKHNGLKCSMCSKDVIGTLWKCQLCHYISLCHNCYNNDRHETMHSFVRFTTPSSKGIPVPPRGSSAHLNIHGIFDGATVVRGTDWDWGDQDGSSQGIVQEVQGWENESARSVVRVIWSGNSVSNVYRCGHKGKMDVCCLASAGGGKCYPQHLAKLGEPEPVLCSNWPINCPVLIEPDLQKLKRLQDGHGGWNPNMALLVGLRGRVHRVTEGGDVRVKFEGHDKRWTINPLALKKIDEFTVGDSVRVLSDWEKFKVQQEGHGGYTDVMKQILGKIGTVTNVFIDGDLHVTFTLLNLSLTLSPENCEIQRLMEVDQDMDTDDHPEVKDLLMDLHEHSMDRNIDPSRLVQEAAQGNLESVREILEYYPGQVNISSDKGETALQVAAHQGHVKVVKLLLDKGSEVNTRDTDGDTALHYSVYGRQESILRHLLTAGAAVNSVNCRGCSPLHIAVNKQYTGCVDTLLDSGADVNLQDSHGDTVLHDAISKANPHLLNKLLANSLISCRKFNKRGHNVLHTAVSKENIFAVQRLMSHDEHLVHEKTSDGQTCLHLGAGTGNTEVLGALLSCDTIDLDFKSRSGHTPLMISATQGHLKATEILIDHGASLSATDDNGNTCLHLVLNNELFADTSDRRIFPTAQEVFNELSQPSSRHPILRILTMACFLVSKGAPPYESNNHGDSPMDLVKQPRAFRLIMGFRQAYPTGTLPRSPITPTSPLAPTALCTLCLEEPAEVTFEPCRDRVVCRLCSPRLKKCPKCQERIERKLGQAEDLTTDDGSLRRRVEQLEVAVTCQLCMERDRGVAFMCGHCCCKECSRGLKKCPFCRRKIEHTIDLY